MTRTAAIQATRRDVRGTRAARRLRAAGQVPAVLYGHGEPTVSLSLNETELRSLVRHGGHGLLEVAVDGAIETVVIKDLQYDHLGSAIYHVDFARVSADERVSISVPIVLKGTAPGVKAGGVLEHAMHEIEMECAASNLVEQIVVNVNDLQLDGEITVADLVLPPGAAALVDADRTVVRVVKVQIGEEETAETAGPAVEPELIRPEKKADEGEE